ncbi:MAG TPA: PQQ-binding-like beta-propeller repeat protein, partial [Pyrinomonadaceae bacterium]|nr:PQQ-binding-like beta-propeller repeat protein [Pyrinomonadaceae bacterium]
VAPVLLCTLLLSAAARAQNWPQFRGPQASGVAQGAAAVPATFDAEKAVNLRWKVEIPGLAHSSPVVWGNKVFVTTAVSSEPKPEARFGLYGDVEPVKNDPKHSWKVYALDKATGKILWERVAYEGIPKVKRHPKSSHAASTPATDGKYLIALMGSEGLYAYDMSGKLVWKQDLGVLDAGWFYDADYQWEYAASPIIYKNMVIVQADIQKNSFIAAYDLKTGKQIWKTMREGELPGWSTPAVYELKGRAELITAGAKAIRGYDPTTGKELWKLGPMAEIATPTPIIAHDLIYVTSGYRPVQPIYAIKPGAAGDISLKDGKESSESIAWSKQRGGPYMPTPIVYGDLFYACSNNGVLTAYNAKTGEQVYRERLAGKGGAFTASPVAADGKLYFASEDGEVFVVKAGPKYEFVGTNPVGEVMMATPAISDGLLLVRGVNHLFAFGEGGGATKTAGAKSGN